MVVTVRMKNLSLKGVRGEKWKKEFVCRAKNAKSESGSESESKWGVSSSK